MQSLSKIYNSLVKYCLGTLTPAQLLMGIPPTVFLLLNAPTYAPSSTTGEIREGYIYVAAADQKDLSSLQLLRVNQGDFRTLSTPKHPEKRKEGWRSSLQLQRQILKPRLQSTEGISSGSRHIGLRLGDDAGPAGSIDQSVAGGIRGWQLEVEAEGH